MTMQSGDRPRDESGVQVVWAKSSANVDLILSYPLSQDSKLYCLTKQSKQKSVLKTLDQCT